MNASYKTRFIGLLFFAGGIAYLGEQFGFWSFSIFFPGWWTIFIIVPAIFSMIDVGFRFSNSVMLLLGAYFLLDANEWIDYRLTMGAIFALLCMVFGIKLIIGSNPVYKDKKRSHVEEEDGIKNIHTNVCFSSKRIRARGIVNSLDAQCIFGTQLIDLSEADVHDMQYCTIDNVFGCVDVIVRDDINFVVKHENIFGSCEIQDEPAGIYDLYIKTSCVFGKIHLRKMHIEEDILEGNYREK